MWRPSRNVVALSVVSFLTDASTEIIAPLLPIFLVGTLGASAAFVGIIEGAAESVASLVKLASGWWADHSGRRKPLIVVGYGLASLVRPLVAIAQTAPQVLAIRITDRIGKGLRGAPRDALLADSTPAAERGRAFGFHRAADHAGAVAGPIIAIICLQLLQMDIRSVFWVALVPGMLALLVAIVFVRERGALPAPKAVADMRAQQHAEAVEASGQLAGKQGRLFAGLMTAILLFTLGNSTDAFLLLRANQLGVSVASLPLLWIVLHIVKSGSSTHGGALSDKFGRRPLITMGWLLYALVYAGFAFAIEQWHAWVLFGVYGLVFGMVEGSEKAMVADVVPPVWRGRAFGWYHATVGIGALPASVLFGVLWDQYGVSAAFLAGAAFAVLAVGMLALVPGLDMAQKTQNLN